MRYTRFRFLVIGISTLLFGGCATMANIDQQVSVTTQPDDAQVTIGSIAGTTPMSATVPGGYSIPQTIQVTKEGYQPQTVSIQRGFRTSHLVQDFLPGLLLGPIPLLVDAITGDWWYVANTNYHIKLHPIPGVVSSAPTSRQEVR
jgi:PEGA domain-containing protein